MPWLYIFLFWLIVCVCLCTHMQATWKTDEILWQFSFHCEDSEDWTQTVRLGGSQSLYQLAHFASPLCIDRDIFKIPKFSNKPNGKMNFNMKQNYMRKKIHCEFYKSKLRLIYLLYKVSEIWKLKRVLFWVKDVRVVSGVIVHAFNPSTWAETGR